MKALSLTQPWAALVARGVKRVETCSWGTDHRGPLAIHAASRIPRGMALMPRREPLAGALSGVRLQFGAVLALARLVDCRPTVSVVRGLSEDELAFGDFSPGRWAWMLEEIEPLAEPLALRGGRGLWDLPAWAAQACLAGLVAGGLLDA